MSSSVRASQICIRLQDFIIVFAPFSCVVGSEIGRTKAKQRCQRSHQGVRYNPSVKTTLPKLRPMRLAQRPKPFDHSDWIFEIKYDGFRALAHVRQGEAIKRGRSWRVGYS
ncbi:MAG: hypothetical protein DMG13_32670 [Acidobacteria bacterium]|nr:MAG: hypothetical protein DMG13_32670 [Acidobacteriota bacterium]